jgi:hypothetical protein
MTQVTYLKSKVLNVSNDEIKKLVISNPYTRGLIFLMQAKNETGITEKLELFRKAKEHLYHVKFHYVECLIELLDVLKNHKLESEYFINWNEAVSICKKLYFRKLLHTLELMNVETQSLKFSSNYYKISISYDKIKLHVDNCVTKNKNFFKGKNTKVQKNIAALTEDFENAI